MAAHKGSAAWVEPAAEVCHWLEWSAFDGLDARKGLAVSVEPAAEVCHWSEWSAFDGLAARKGSAVSVEPVAEEHHPAWKQCGFGWQVAAVFEWNAAELAACFYSEQVRFSTTVRLLLFPCGMAA